MEKPATWRGYDDKGECVAEFTAQDANQFIDPAQVQAAIDNLETAFSDGFIQISTSLLGLCVDASDAVIVQGTKMDTVIQDTAQAINSLPSQVLTGITQLYDLAVEAHDNIQRQANEAAQQAAASASGVVSTKQVS